MKIPQQTKLRTIIFTIFPIDNLLSCILTSLLKNKQMTIKKKEPKLKNTKERKRKKINGIAAQSLPSLWTIKTTQQGK